MKDLIFPRSSQEQGFTLIEILIAVVTLSVALITLMGMQGAVIQQEIRDRDRQIALGMAQRILAGIEMSEDALPEGETKQKAGELLKTVFDGASTLAEDRSDELESTLRVSQLVIPGVNDSKPDIQQIDLEIRWGPTSLDRVNFLYLKVDHRAEP